SVGDNPVGASPIVVTLAPGRYRVRVEKPGYAPIDTEEDVRSNERTYVVVPMATEAAAAKRKGSKPRTTTTHTVLDAAAKKTLPQPTIGSKPSGPAAQPQPPYDDGDDPATSTQSKPADKG